MADTGETRQFRVPDGEDERLDRLVARQFPDLSRSLVQRLIRAGAVRVNGAPARPAARPQPGDVVAVQVPPSEAAPPAPEALPLDVLYEDAHLVVVNKPAGLVVHPAAGHPRGTLVNALLARYPQIVAADLDPARPGIVHRLDRDTSGLLLVALDRGTQQALQAAFRSRAVDKRYLALVHGVVTPERGAIEAPIGRDPHHRQRMAVVPEGGRPARTEYAVREIFPDCTLLEARLLTGRTHQLRVHLAAIGHPVVGDTVYGRRRQPVEIDRQFLHAWRLAFAHPVTGAALSLEAPLPADLLAPLATLRRRSGSAPLPDGAPD